MKKSLIKSAMLEIKNRKKIFLSILFMSLLGVGFFSGINATAPNMKKTAHSYYEEQNLYDIEVLSSTGITKDKIEELKEIKNILEVEGNISYDRLITYKDFKPTVKIYSILDNINKLKILEGRLPQNNEECVIDSKILKNVSDFEIGDYVEIEDDTNTFKNKKIKIVGVVRSPLYTSDARENTTISTGTIDYFLYMPIDNFNYNEIYTSAYITIDTTKESYTDKYDKEVEKIEKKIKEQDNNLYILNRSSNISYSSYAQDTERIDNIAEVFPLIFFIVATLISLTSMTRMVEEQRVELGTLKALGYNKTQISLKYVLYASIATIIGGFLGIIIGVLTIPSIIHMLYETMYITKNLIISYNWEISLIGLFVSYVCILGATLFVIEKELLNNPAVLMRPKAPKNGKRVFLEKIDFIWKRLSFTSKVTIRNMFRYKKKFLMTIIGIAGCTGLIFAGFALKDAVTNLLPAQYGNIFTYQLQAISNSNITEEIINNLNENNNIKEFTKIKMENIKVSYNDITNDETQIIVINDNIENFIKLKDYKTKEKLKLTSGIIITEKLASLLNIKVGDKVEIKNSNNKINKIEVIGITENYLQHYIYINEETYNNNFEEVLYNMLLINSDNKNITELSEELLKTNYFSNVIMTENIKNTMNDTLENMNYVVWVLIIAAGVLAFCVLYNLSNVNISERIRELSTIKVLGFYDKEVHNYVEKETTFLTIIGIILGVFLGNYLSVMVISTCELETMLMPRSFGLDCYIYSIIITIIFTFVVSVFCYFNLKKINMIESLKSVE